MTPHELLQQAISGADLTAQEMAAVIEQIVQGELARSRPRPLAHRPA